MGYSQRGDDEGACRRDSVQRRSACVTIHLLRSTRGVPMADHRRTGCRHLCSTLLLMGFAEP